MMVVLRALAAITALVVTLTAAARVTQRDPTPTPVLIATIEPSYSVGDAPQAEAPAAYPAPATPTPELGPDYPAPAVTWSPPPEQTAVPTPCHVTVTNFVWRYCP